jgi:hypothetical protein
MKVITPYPIIKNGRTVKSGSVTVNSSFDGDNFSFAEGDYSTLPNINAPKSDLQPKKDEKAKKKVDADSILSAISKGANTYADVVNAFKKKGSNPPSEAEFNDAKNKSSKKMSTTVKIAIGVASLALIITIFAIVKKKK